MRDATSEKYQRLACSFVRMIVAYNQMFDKGGIWQGGYRLDEWAALLMSYRYEKKVGSQ